jgi:hypothetical protein
LGDLDLDGNSEIAVSAVNHMGGSGQIGAIWILSLTGNGQVVRQLQIGDDRSGFVPAKGSDCFGSSIASMGDLDGDGTVYLAVGASYDSIGWANRTRGSVWILKLDYRLGKVVTQRRLGHQAGGFWGSIEAFDQFGSSVAWLQSPTNTVTGRLIIASAQANPSRLWMVAIDDR